MLCRYNGTYAISQGCGNNKRIGPLNSRVLSTPYVTRVLNVRLWLCTLECHGATCKADSYLGSEGSLTLDLTITWRYPDTARICNNRQPRFPHKFNRIRFNCSALATFHLAWCQTLRYTVLAHSASVNSPTHLIHPLEANHIKEISVL